ncbi:MAG: tetratricopeptide repeat protein, partial [Odoribacter sp.]|nr:tetratricopeptide repeat protein [Odoribacter sp.]
VSAQKERKFIREGNNLFHGNNFENAEREYRKALDQKDESFEAAFNLADAMYKQQRYDEALEQFQALAASETDKERLGEIYHNIGNTLLTMNKVDESIEAYKNSLRNRPESMETKYNLEYARHRKQQEDENQDDNQGEDENQDQDKNDQDKNQNQDQNQDNQDENQDKDKGNDKQDQDNQDPGNDDADQNQQQQDQESKISKEDAQRLLEALQNDEKKVQEKVQQQKAEEQKAKRQKIEKDW